MVYIQFTNHPDLQEYHNDDYMPSDYRITNINDSGVANVREEVADHLVDAKDSVEYYSRGDDE